MADKKKQLTPRIVVENKLAWYKAVFNFSPEAIIIVDKRGEVLDANGRLYDWLDYTKEEVVGKNLMALPFITKKSKVIALANLGKRFLGQEVLPYDLEFISKAGEIRVGRIKGELLKDSNGKKTADLVMVMDVTESGKAKLALEKRDRILEAATGWGERFLRDTDWEKYVNEVLESLGEAIAVCRVYIFVNQKKEKEDIVISQKFEWVGPGVSAQIDNPDMQTFPMVKSGFRRWADLLSQRGIIAGPVKSMPASEQKVLVSQDIKSILAVPIFEGSHWWGFIGFDDCKSTRGWDVPEIGALKVIADLLGATIERQHLQKENQERLEKLEAMEPINEKRYQKLIDQQMEIIRLKKKLGEQPPSVKEIDK